MSDLGWECICDKSHLGEHEKPDCPGKGQAIHLVPMPVTESELRYALIAAVEGGIQYWAQVRRYVPTEGTVEVKQGDTAGARWRKVSSKTILAGMQVCAEKFPHVLAQWLRDRNGDAGDADCFLQAGLFGDIVYG